MKRVFLLLIFMLSFVGNSQQLNDTVRIDSEYGDLTFTKTCKLTDGISTVNLSYDANLYLDDAFLNVERRKETVLVKITINENGEINAYEFSKEPSSFELTRFFNNFFKDIIRNKSKNGNKNLNCSKKAINYIMHFTL